MTEEKQLHELNLIELKALAYDLIASGERTKQQLATVNNEILKKLNDASITTKAE